MSSFLSFLSVRLEVSSIGIHTNLGDVLRSSQWWNMRWKAIFQIVASFLGFHFNLYFVWKVAIQIKCSNPLISQDATSLILISCLHITNVKIKLNILAKHHFVSTDNPRSVIYTEPCFEKASICMHSVNKVYSCSSCRHRLASSCVKMQICKRAIGTFGFKLAQWEKCWNEVTLLHWKNSTVACNRSASSVLY